jgi:glycosyltransferase involved in cell wall biosynthesis
MTAKTRVAHIALQLETGGLERLLIEHARHIDRPAFDLHFISITSRGPVAAELEALGWPVTALNTPPGLRPSLIPTLARLFKSHAFDAIHTHNTKPLLYAGPAARLAGVPCLIHTRHGQRHGHTRLHDTLFRLASRCADRMVCVSDDAAHRCREEGIAPRLITTVPNGIDTDRFTYTGPAPHGPALYVGRLATEKGLDTLLRAASIASRRVPNFQLHLAGDGACRSTLEALTRDLGLSYHVKFLGAVSDIPALLRTASVFVLSSISEGMPVTALEAMATGLPVVATSVGGTPEAVEHTRTGLLVDSGDHAALADALTTVMLDPSRARRMGESGRERVESRFSAAAMVARYEAMYHEFTHSDSTATLAPKSARHGAAA